MIDDLIAYEAEISMLEETARRLRQDSNSRAVFVIAADGQPLAAAGEIENYDITSLASLTAGNIAGADGLAKLIGEREFSVIFHEGERDNVHISIAANRAILVVIFDDRSSLGLVRLRVKRAAGEFERIFEAIAAKASRDPFPQLTDDRIDDLFSE